MKPLSAFPHAELHTIRGVFTDIDDTLTTNWQLPMSAFDAADGSHPPVSQCPLMAINGLFATP